MRGSIGLLPTTLDAQFITTTDMSHRQQGQALGDNTGRSLQLLEMRYVQCVAMAKQQRPDTASTATYRHKPAAYTVWTKTINTCGHACRSNINALLDPALTAYTQTHISTVPGWFCKENHGSGCLNAVECYTDRRLEPRPRGMHCTSCYKG